MILSDQDLRKMLKSGELGIAPIKRNTIQQNGVDLRLNDEIGLGRERDVECIDVTKKIESELSFEVIKTDDNAHTIPAKKHILLSTIEKVQLPDDIMGFCGLRSTFARWGFVSPMTIVDAGFEGTLTIETFYGGETKIKIPVGARFLHVVFAKMMNPADKPYDGTYKGQSALRLPKSIEADEE